MRAHQAHLMKNALVTTYIPALLLQLVTEDGADPDEILCDTGVSPEQLASPDHLLTYRQVSALIRNCINFSNNPRIGLQLGTRIRNSHLAEYGMAWSSAASIDQALNMSVKYQPIFGGAFNVRRVDYTDSTALVISKLVHLGEIYYFNQDAWMSSVFTNTTRLCECTLEELGLRAEFDYPRPKCIDPYINIFGENVKFDQRYCQVLLPREIIHRPLVGHCPAFLQRAIKECDRVLQSLNTPTSLPELARLFLRTHVAQSPSTEDLARHLNMSVRTLNRRLGLLSTNFRQLLKEVKLDVASEILFTTNLPISIVAERAGFSDASNFVKAFREWSGSTPNRYRKVLKHP